MKKKTALIFVALAVVLTACGVKSAAPQNSDLRGLGGAPSEPSVNEGAPVSSMESVNDAYSVPGAAAGTAVQERMVQVSVSMRIVVADPQEKVDAIDQLAKDLGGFLVSMNMYQTYTSNGDIAPEGQISIRIPSEKLDNALNTIKEDAIDVQNETRTGTDVTASYVDLQSQLTNLERAEQDLLDIMDEAQNNPGNDSTTKTQDVLNVYNQIVGIRGQIEQIKGQMKYYIDTTDTSLIDVTIIAEETIQPIEIAGWKPAGVARNAIQALVNFLKGFVNFVIWLVLLVLPVLIVILGPIALIVWGIVSLVRRNKNKKKGQAAK